jgi:hypothetical protein
MQPLEFLIRAAKKERADKIKMQPKVGITAKAYATVKHILGLWNNEQRCLDFVMNLSNDFFK